MQLPVGNPVTSPVPPFSQSILHHITAACNLPVSALPQHPSLNCAWEHSLSDGGNILQAPSIDWKGAQAGKFGPGGYLGVTSVPLPGSSTKAAPPSDRAGKRQEQEQSLQVRWPLWNS